MAQILMIYDFGGDEEAAQQARHKIDGWKQGFRLGDKLACKFEREENAAGGAEASDADGEDRKPAKKAASKKSKDATAKKSAARVRLLVRLGFSAHEKLTQQRWLDRIPSEEPFASAKGETIRQGDPEFEKSSALYEGLD